MTLVAVPFAGAIIEQNPDYGFHFIDGNEQPFYLLSKSAYRLLALGEQDWKDVIDDARNNGYNSLRIWLMFPENWSICNDFIVLPWVDAEYGTDWYNYFDDTYWEKLRNVLIYMAAEATPGVAPIEAELCIFDWGSLALLPWADATPTPWPTPTPTSEGTPTFTPTPCDNPFIPDGQAEGTKFLYTGFAPPTGTPATSPDARLVTYLDKLCTESGAWPDNWRLEIGNQMGDCWLQKTKNPWVVHPEWCISPGNMAPDYDHWIEGSDEQSEESYNQLRNYYMQWIREVGVYLQNKGFPNMITNSSPNGHGAIGYQSTEQSFWSKNEDWNCPIEFHGSRWHAGDDDRTPFDVEKLWYLDNYTRYYEPVRSDSLIDPLLMPKPIVDGEPNKYANEEGTGNTNRYGQHLPEEGRWNFYIGAMAGCYPTYHSQYAYELPVDKFEYDVGDDFLRAFYGIMRWGDVNSFSGTDLPIDPSYYNQTEWYKMEPDFQDTVIDNTIGCNYTGGLNKEMIFPLKYPQTGTVEKGFLYTLVPNETTLTPNGASALILNEDLFPSGSKYRFTWFRTDLSKVMQQERCMGPGTRFIEIPSLILDRLNEVKLEPEPVFSPQERQMQFNRDAIVFYKKIEDNCDYSEVFRDSLAGTELELESSIVHPGEHFVLNVNHEIDPVDISFFTQRILAIIFDDGNVPVIYFKVIENGTETLFDLLYEEDYPETSGSFMIGYVEPVQYDEYDALGYDVLDNPGLWYNPTPVPFAFTESYHNRYVRTDGDDHNNGMSPDTAWATLSHAVSAINQASPRPSAEDSYRIYLGSETFFVPDGAFTVSPFTRIEGMGPKKTTIKSATNSGLFFPEGSRNSIAHCTLDRLPIAVSNSELHLYNDYLINCTGTQTSAVYAVEGDLNIKDCLFVMNRYGILESDSQVRVSDCTFDLNRNAIWMDGAPASGSTIITNSIITNSLSSAIKAAGVFPELTYCCFFNNTVDLDGIASFTEHNSTTNPLFVDPANLNYCLQQTIVDPLQGDSPCVDSGRETQVPFDMNYGSTRTDKAPDGCQMDRGYRAVKIKIQSVIGEVDEPDDGGIINKIIEGTKPDEVVIKEDELLGQVIRIIFNNDPCRPVVINPGLIENPNGISMIDVTGDDYNDLIVTTDSGSIIYENDKTGNFIENKSNANGFAHLVNSTMTGDINHDGKNDLIYCCQDGVRVLLAPLSKKSRPDLYLKSGNVQSASIGVLDSQKKTSLVVIDENGDIQVFFDPFTNSKTQDQVVLEPIYAESLRLIDVNNDGLTDIQVVGSGEEYLNDGNNGFYQTAESASGVTTQDSARN